MGIQKMPVLVLFLFPKTKKFLAELLSGRNFFILLAPPTGIEPMTSP